MVMVRPAAVAGAFYPARAEELRSLVSRMVDEAARHRTRIQTPPKAIIVPHAGYQYSGPIAASAYAQLIPIASSIEKVVLLGPAHHVCFQGLAVSTADEFETPLGHILLDKQAIEMLHSLPQVRRYDAAHGPEHSLEVQLPFLQVILGSDFLLTPLVVGMAGCDEVKEALETVWGDDACLLVVSSDLSHFHDVATARRIDRHTTGLIEGLRCEELTGEYACGYAGIRGLLAAAPHHGLKVTTLDVRNSADTAGPPDRVVGYGAYVLHP